MRVTAGSIVLKSASVCNTMPAVSHVRVRLLACNESYKQEYERAEESEQEEVEAFDISLRDAPIEHATVMINVDNADITVRAMLDLFLDL